MNYYRLDNGNVTATVGVLDAEEITLDEYETVMNAAAEAMAKKEAAMTRIAELKKMLSETDYKAIKYSEGLIPDEEYAPVKAWRQEWRDEINRIEQETELKSIESEEWVYADT